MKMFARILISAALLYPQMADAQAQPVTVIVVRHAEKAAEPKDNPPLTGEGAMRAAKLTEALQHAGVTTIYSTPYARTLETAQPLARALNLTVTETPIPNRSVAAYAADIAARVKRDSGVVVVVGHSNTMGPVIKALGGPDIGEIPDERYDDLFVLTVQDGKPPRLVKSKYGARWDSVTK
jgi:broad specificity phosphatase PhoE